MLSAIPNYKATEANLWQGRHDSLPGERFFQQVRLINLANQSLDKTEKGTALVGFCSDEGIRRNDGRIGAQSGPGSLRQQLAKLPCHKDKPYVDLGNIVCDGNLESAQEQFGQLIQHCHQQGYKTLAFGGGHEIAWGHFLGLRDQYPKLGIINFDAHFDLRPLKEGLFATSGTPFLQIARNCQQTNRSFDYCCLGIQAIANTKSLYNTAKELNVSFLTTEQINQESVSWQKAFLDDFISKQDSIYLSLCLDVFAECFAPGVSAPQPMGLTPWQTLPLLKYIVQTGKVVSLDIAELSPPLDQEHRTARLAASIVAQLLDYY